MKKRLDDVLSGGGGLMKSAEEVETPFDNPVSNTDSSGDDSSESNDDESGDDALSYFEKLANE